MSENIITVGALWCAPLKSAKGLYLKEAKLDERGITYDRQWMVAGETGMFVAQRDNPSEQLGIEVRSMCLIQPEISGDALVLHAPKMDPLFLPLSGVSGKEEEVQVWRSRCLAVDQGRDAAEWLSGFLSRERPGRYRLMRMADGFRRPSKEGNSAVGFADSFPFMNLSMASLNDLNWRLEDRRAPPVPMNRFRPNIVFLKCEPYEEDHFALIKIKEVTLEGKKLCDRCLTTCTDQDTAERFKEPLATLATYRRGCNLGMPGDTRVYFGRNFNHLTLGTIRVGDMVQVLSRD